MTRRGLIGGLLLAPVVGGCAGTTVSAAVQQAAADVQLVASGLASLTPLLLGQLGVPAGTITRIRGYIGQVQADAGLVAQQVAAGTTPATGTVQDIASLVASIASVAQQALPATAATAGAIAIIQAAVSLVPLVLVAFGVTAAVPLGERVYAPDAARRILREAASGP